MTQDWRDPCVRSGVDPQLCRTHYGLMSTSPSHRYCSEALILRSGFRTMMVTGTDSYPRRTRVWTVRCR